jgi:hypothetical protein
MAVEEEIKADIADAEARRRTVDDRAFELVGEREAFEAKIKAEKREPTEEELAHLASLSDRILAAVNAGTNMSDRINQLRSPGEHERRTNDKLANIQSVRRLRMAENEEKQKKPTPADQGVPAQYLNEAGTSFKIGMDARLKSDLVSSITGEITTENPGASLHVFSEAEARKILEARDWMGFLERKQAILAEKNAKSEARQKEREEAARVKAAEKEAKAQEREQAKAAKAAEREAAKVEAAKNAEGGAAADAKGKGQAVPDPKGGKGKSRAKAGTSK